MAVGHAIQQGLRCPGSTIAGDQDRGTASESVLRNTAREIIERAFEERGRAIALASRTDDAQIGSVNRLTIDIESEQFVERFDDRNSGPHRRTSGLGVRPCWTTQARGVEPKSE
ncbi:hypothetical protein G6O69_01810 [Pseudenhygromyxa sp. WMMC2535]|uniref:hypothetical protein n=1 Tax=Pseudenhygromyxa sp. WMMC2535 TaxID=2712867 RepID=UPI0015956229|nr:hypothetical protein [Pseudenhygromyxa sp. WMMC2535]NVB36550.1 hypothetical protein [Pseudenhygromyxa sp. WMMC2535]